MAVLCLIYMVMALRTNVCFVVIFFLLAVGLCLDTTAHWLLAMDYEGNAAAASSIVKVRHSPSFQAAMRADVPLT